MTCLEEGCDFDKCYTPLAARTKATKHMAFKRHRVQTHPWDNPEKATIHEPNNTPMLDDDTPPF